MRPAYSASACVLVYAGGQIRDSIEESALGVDRFVNTAAISDPVAGAVLG